MKGLFPLIRLYEKSESFLNNLLSSFNLESLSVSKKERSNLKFGDYIHKYFYDKSIADGYTLRIKKEQIDTAARTEIRENLEIENKDLNSADVYESNDYIQGVSSYIEKDFRNFRLINTDFSIGGMIVCRSNAQAKKIHEWYKLHSSLTTGLVLSDSEDTAAQNEINRQNQINFRENGYPDILVVHFMLTTGYDVKRLSDGWTVKTADGSLSSHFENTIVITEGEPIILTAQLAEEVN